jgi:amidase
LAAVSGYPSVAVPAELVRGLPVGIAFIGRPQSEALLIEMAAVFERARGALPAPEFLPTLEE